MIYYYTGERKSPRPIVAFGIIGAVLSGITFVSIPGMVGNNYFITYSLFLETLLDIYLLKMFLSTSIMI